MAEMYKVFERLLKENNKTPSRVSAETGIPKSALSEWKNGRYQLKADKIMILADYFGVPVTVFFGDEETECNQLNTTTKQNKLDVSRLAHALSILLSEQTGVDITITFRKRGGECNNGRNEHTDHAETAGPSGKTA